MGARLPCIYVIAGSADQWDYWVRFIYLPAVHPQKVRGPFGDLEIDGVRVFWVAHVHRLQGRRIEEAKGDRVVLYGTYEKRKDWPEIAHELAIRWES